MNVVLRSSSIPDRYPLNQNSAMVVNVLAAYGFYLVPVFFPSVIWLAVWLPFCSVCSNLSSTGIADQREAEVRLQSRSGGCRLWGTSQSASTTSTTSTLKDW